MQLKPYEPGRAGRQPRAGIWSMLDRIDAVLRARPRVSMLVLGAVATLAMPPVFALPALMVALYGLVIVLDDVSAAPAGRARWWRAFAVGWLFGFGYFVMGLYWISASLFVEPEKFVWLLPFSASLIPAGLAVFYGLATLASLRFWQAGVARIVALAIAFAVAEWLRGHIFTGLPWNMLGYALTLPPYLMQTAALTGTYALNLLAVLLCALPAVARTSPHGTFGRMGYLALPIVSLAVMLGHGAYRLAQPEPPPVAGVRLRLVQPNISQDMKWRHENRESIFRNYLDLSRRNAHGQDDGLAGITHVIWPESAIPFLLLNSPGALEAVGDLLPDGTYLITGAIRLEETPGVGGGPAQRHVYNSILALDDRARLTTFYDKVHLVPFGEYLPFQKTLEAIGLEQLTRLQGGFAVGKTSVRSLEVPGLPAFSPLICYEAIFPDEVVSRGTRPAFFLNVTNDGWFGRTAGPHQHLHQARVRAVEQGVPMVRVANTGISAVIDSRGRMLHRAGLNQVSTIDSDLPAALAPTPYSRLGEAALLVTLLAAAAWLAITLHRASKP